jgi:ribosomal protein S18 acetylase RimI-like enzyme
VPLPWETRNLGVESYGLSDAFLAAPDGPLLAGTLADLRNAHRSFFVQARFAPDSRIAQLLETHGFYFVESTLRPTASLTSCEALDRFAAEPSSVLPRRYAESDLALRNVSPSDGEAAAAIRSIAGQSFVDDRFHADHNCPPGAADRRYRLWVDDLLADGAVRFQVLALRASPIAFMASRDSDLLLAGFERRYANAGLGEFFWLLVLSRLRADGVTRVRTRISVNNGAALNLYARLNFRLRDPESTFHLWARG